MKRMVSVFAAVMLAVSAFCAGHSWNDDIFGCRLGVSTVEDVKKAVEKAHRTFEPTDDEGSFIAYDALLHGLFYEAVTFNFKNGVLEDVSYIHTQGGLIDQYNLTVEALEESHGRGTHFTMDNASMVDWQTEKLRVNIVLDGYDYVMVLFAKP